jgi:hypothetical protein
MQGARYHYTSALLEDGRVLVAGGYDAHDVQVASAEVFDPRTNAWSSAGHMRTARANHTETRLAGGRVLVAGGGDRPTGFVDSTEIYDPATNAWSAGPRMATARGFATATPLPSGRVLLAGGYGNDGDLASAELFDPRTGRWSSVGPMATPRGQAAAALLPDGRVLIAGGQRYTGAFLQSTEVFDPNRTGRLGPTDLQVTPAKVRGQRRITLTYRAPDAGSTVIRIQRARSGGGWVRLPERIVHADSAGRNRVLVALTRGARRFTPGSYRLVVARPSAGTAAVTVAFTIAA